MGPAVMILVAVAAVLLVILISSLQKLRHWSRKGVPHLQPLPVVGNMLDVFLQRKSFPHVVHDLYMHFSSKPLIGMYAGSEPVLLVRDLDLAKDITIKDFDHFTDHVLIPDSDIDPMFHRVLFCLKGDKWKTARTQLTSAFTSGKLKDMFSVVKQSGKELVDVIDQYAQKGQEMDIGQVVARYSIDIIASCAFGAEAGALKDPENSSFFKMVNSPFSYGWREGLAVFSLMFMRTLYRLMKVPLLPGWREQMLRNMVAQSAGHREGKPRGRMDIFDTLLQLKGDKSVSDDEFISQVWQMQAAGSETSANTLTFALWELARNQDIQNKLRTEIMEALEKDKGEVLYQTTQDLEYLDCIVKETLRRWPILPWLDRRCTKDYHFSSVDLTVEKGTVVMVPLYSYHHDPELFPDPEEFDPERWAAENKDSVPKLAHIPFGVGPRVCIGARFGLMSIKSALIHILRRYRVTLGKNTARTPQELDLNTYSFLILPDKSVDLVFTPLKA